MKKEVKIGSREFNIDSPHTYIMGILNITPDSFSDGGKYNGVDQALGHVEKMIEEGADIIDVGGESTRPGYIKIGIEEEINRVCDVVEAIKSRFDIPISIDTYKREVAKASLEAGADLINDIWGFRYSGNMAEIIGEYGVPAVIMHNDHMGRSLEEREDNLKKASENYQDNTSYNNKVLVSKYSEESKVVDRVIEGLNESIEIAIKAGIKKENIIIDPGVGFAKTYRENLLVLNNLAAIREKIKLPMLLGASRKSVIGNALNLPVEEREEGTISTSIIAAMAGCSFVRVHNVAANRRALDMYEAIRNVK
ncbi:MAG: dihydropteroate synthase [Eubacterium sp.]|nr:dihydropteroate synthase [Eubacterium sp.]